VIDSLFLSKIRWSAAGSGTTSKGEKSRFEAILVIFLGISLLFNGE